MTTSLTVETRAETTDPTECWESRDEERTRETLFRIDIQLNTMTVTIEVSEEVRDKIDAHREEDVSRDQFLLEVLDHFETEGRFLREGYSGEP